MNVFNRLRVLLGIGCRRLATKLGLPADRRQGPADRRDAVRSHREATMELDRLAHDKWKGETPGAKKEASEG